MTQFRLHIGGHYGRDKNEKILDCLKKNKKMGADVFQTFMGHHYKTTLRYKTILEKGDQKEIKLWLKKNKTQFVIHSLLTINFCNPTTSEPHYARYQWAVENLVYDIKMGKKLYAGTKSQPLLLVIHLGSTHSQYYNIEEAECRRRYIKNLINVLHTAEREDRGSTKNVKILIETNAGEGSKIGKTIDNLAKLWKLIPRKYKHFFGFCIDTAHIFSAGYPIHTVAGIQDFIKEWDKKLGLGTIGLIHLNDSLTPFNEHKDKHKHIGEGYIYSPSKGGDTNALIPLANLAAKKKIPIVLETREERRYGEEIRLLRKLAIMRKRIIVRPRGGGKTKSKKDYRPRIIEIFRELATFHDSLSKRSGSKAASDKSSVFRAKSYITIVKTLEKIEKPIYSVEDVRGIPGIGKGTLEKIEEIIRTNDLTMYREIQKDPYYQAMRELQTITGIGPETANKFIESGINSVEKLRQARDRGEIELTHIQTVSLKYYKDLKKKIPRAEISAFKNKLQKLLKDRDYGVRVEMGGSYRMGKRESGDMDIILLATDREARGLTYNKFIESRKYQAEFEEIIELLKTKGYIIDTYWKGKNAWMGIMMSGMGKGTARHADIRWIPEKYEETYLLFFGSGEIFSRMIRKVAKEQGYKLTEWGLFDIKKNKYLEIYTEKGIFAKLGLEYIKPADR